MDTSFNLYRTWVFATVAQHGNVTRAAKVLGISQPAASLQIKALEQNLGLRLFDRAPRGMVLSLAGRQYLQQALKVLAELERLEAFRAFDEEAEGAVEVAASHTPGAYWLPQVLADFQAQYPKVSCELGLHDSSAALRRVQQFDVAMAVVGDLPILRKSKEFQSERIASDALVLTYRKDFQDRLPVQLEGEKDIRCRLIVREQGSSTRIQSEALLAGLRCSFFQVLELGSGEAVKEAVVAGLGVSFLSSWAVRREIRSGLLAQAASITLRRNRHFYAVRRSDRPLFGCARVLWDFLVTSGVS